MFLPLGPTPLANSFLHSVEEFAGEASFPLDVYYCHGCSLVQLLDVIDPEVLFRNYIYVSGTSDTIAAHYVRYAQAVVDRTRPSPEDLVVEIASNDGSLLKCFRPHNVRTLGVEPATNIAEKARAAGIDTVNLFFDSKTAADIRANYGAAKAVIANNVLAHVDDTQDFLRGARHLLDQDGLLIVEAPYLRDLLEHFEYDTVYHEHLCYFSVTALMRLCEEVGLSIVQMDHVPVHGGSLRMYAGLRETFPDHGLQVREMAATERELGMTGPERFRSFAADVSRHRECLLRLLHQLRAEGKTVAGYGAPAKGNTMLNYCGIGTDLLPYTVDKNPMKVGYYTPGMHIPVLPVTALLERQPDYVLILAWNFAPEIIRQQAEYQNRGGRFIVPIPSPQVV
jgi:hypothetical protein